MNMHSMKHKRTALWIAIGVIVVGVIIASVSLLNPPADTLPANITVQQASDQFAKGAYLLDVREQSEWNEAHVDGAVLIPLGELSARVDEIPTDQDVLIICRSGNRSAQARDLLQAAGLARTTSINGGINAWISASLPVVSGP